MDNEEWRPVPSVPGLKASSLGRVQLPWRSIQMPNGGFRELTPGPTFGHRQKSGRFVIALKHGETPKKVHRFICEAFHGPPPFETAKCLHIDENNGNNIPSNLKWGTQKENLNAPGFLKKRSELSRRYHGSST